MKRLERSGPKDHGKTGVLNLIVHGSTKRQEKDRIETRKIWLERSWGDKIYHDRRSIKRPEESGTKEDLKIREMRRP